MYDSSHDTGDALISNTLSAILCYGFRVEDDICLSRDPRPPTCEFDDNRSLCARVMVVCIMNVYDLLETSYMIKERVMGVEACLERNMLRKEHS